MKVLRYVLGAEVISILHMEEKMIPIDRCKDTSKYKGYVDAAQWQRKLTNFGAGSATANLNQKVLKADLLFPCLLVEHISLNVSKF